MAINSRRKGAKAEREAAKVLKQWTGKTFAKTPASGGLNWKKSNVAGDVVCTKEGHYFPFCVEVKAHAKIDFAHLLQPGIKNVDILDFWNQANRDALKANKEPMVMMRYNGLPKQFYFVIISQSTAKTLHEKHFSGNRLTTLRYHDYQNNLSLMIFKSTEFFTLPYKEVRKTVKQWQREKRRTKN